MTVSSELIDEGIGGIEWCPCDKLTSLLICIGRRKTDELSRVSNVNEVVEFSGLADTKPTPYDIEGYYQILFTFCRRRQESNLRFLLTESDIQKVRHTLARHVKHCNNGYQDEYADFIHLKYKIKKGLLKKKYPNFFLRWIIVTLYK